MKLRMCLKPNKKAFNRKGVCGRKPTGFKDWLGYAQSTSLNCFASRFLRDCERQKWKCQPVTSLLLSSFCSVRVCPIVVVFHLRVNKDVLKLWLMPKYVFLWAMSSDTCWGRRGKYLKNRNLRAAALVSEQMSLFLCSSLSSLCV